VHERHRRRITNARFDAMLKLFVDGRIEPVRYVARPYGKTTILVTVSPIRIDYAVGRHASPKFGTSK